MPTRKYNPVTGKYVEYDDDGNIIRVDISKDVEKFGSGRTPRSERKPSFTKRERLATTPPATRPLPQIAAEALPWLGGAAGAIAGGPTPWAPLTSGAGAFAGDLLRQELQNRLPSTFGELPEDQRSIEGALTNAGVEGAISGVGDLAFRGAGRYLGSVKNKIKAALAQGASATEAAKALTMNSRFLRGQPIEPELKAFADANPDFPITFSQAGGNKITAFLEGTAPSRSHNIRTQQQDILARQFKGEVDQRLSPFETNQAVASGVKQELKTGMNAATNQMHDAYNELLAAARQNKFTYTKPTPKAKKPAGFGSPNAPSKTPPAEVLEVTAPVYAEGTRNLSIKIFDRIKKTHGIESAEALADLVGVDEKASLAALNRFMKMETKGDIPLPIELETAIKLKSLFGKRGFKNLLPAEDEALFGNLNRQLDKDIRQSIIGTSGINKGYSNPDEVMRLFDKANSITSQRASIFRETEGVSSLLDSELKITGNLSKILSDPEEIRRVQSGAANFSPSGSAKVNKYLQGEYLAKMFDDNFNPAKGQFAQDGPLNSFLARENQASIRELFNAQERSNLQRFFRTISKVSPAVQFDSSTSLGWAAAKNGIVLGPSIMNYVFSDKSAESAQRSGLILGATIGAGVFARRALLNPRMVRIATELAQVPANSNKAQVLSRTLFQALRGVPVMVDLADGIKAQMTVGKDGKLDPENSEFIDAQPSN